MNKNIRKLLSFTKYCIENPEQRFWQALRNWSEYNFIYGSRDNANMEDTFYL